MKSTYTINSYTKSVLFFLSLLIVPVSASASETPLVGDSIIGDLYRCDGGGGVSRGEEGG